MVHIPILIFSFSYLRPCSLPQNYSCTYQRVPETNVLESNAVSVMFFDHVQLLQQLFFLKKDCCYRNNSGSGIQLHDGDLEHCLIKEKNRCLYVLPPIYMFWYSRFSLGILNIFVMHYNQQTANLFLAYDSQPVSTINVQYLQ